MHRLFVYGSLLRGLVHHGQLRGADFVGEDMTREAFVCLDLGAYPALLRGEGERVRGEVYAVGDALLMEMDRFEGVPDLYERVRAPLVSAGDAWVYVLAVLAAPPGCIPRGLAPP